MRYTAFGRKTGLRVCEYALGTANFGTGWGAGAEPTRPAASSTGSPRPAAPSSTAPTATSQPSTSS
ncbi:hypothetical protein [Streptomyces sp. D2-8]|uniref:hypothetical protein n=1 Tax=Streptomyces sp. D2-8 TaxID=2707767 RepID=UPI0020C0AF3E|nr:hypothetical protein [Streptomyces sp. D2-8]